MSLNYSREAWERTQRDLRLRVSECDDTSWLLPGETHGYDHNEQTPLAYVGGLDISFVDRCQSGRTRALQHGVACLVVLHLPDCAVVYEDYERLAMDEEYVPGFLGFREVPAFQTLLGRAKVQPQVVFVDGFGILHPRRCGSASHLGVISGLPTIGIGKHLLQVEGLQERLVRSHAAQAMQHFMASPDTRKGCSCPTGWTAQVLADGSTAVLGPLSAGKQGNMLGMAIAGHCYSTRPIYVSIGHKVSLATATRLTLACCQHRIPEPIRQADLKSREYVRRLLARKSPRST